MRTIISSIILAAGVLFSASMLQSCTDYDTPEPVVGDIADADSTKLELTRHVLWINIDGASGSIVKTLVDNGSLPTLASLLQHAKYTFAGLSDVHSLPDGTDAGEENPLTWTSMLTGVDADLHRVSNYSYSPDFNVTDNPVGQKVTYFPSIVQQIAKVSSDVTISVVTPWSSLNRYLGDANSTITTNGDDITETEVLRQLRDENYRLYLVSFRDVLDAGKKDGFTLEDNNYKSALERVDKRIESMLTAIEDRPNHDYEDWLVVVTSNSAGSSDGDFVNATNEQRDVFGIFYYNHYTPFEMKGEMLESVLFGTGNTARIKDPEGKYALTKDPLAIEFTMQMLPTPEGSYNAGGGWYQMIGKSNWGIYRQRSEVDLYINSFGNLGAVQRHLTCGNDAYWHSYYYGFTEELKNSRTLIINADGKTNTREDFTYTPQAWREDNEDIVIHNANTPTDYRIHSLRIWKTSLDDVTLESHTNQSGAVSISHTDYDKLIGEWILESDRIKEGLETDEDGNIVNYWYIDNNVPGMPELRFSEMPVFSTVANTLAGFRNSGNLMVENTTIAPQILYWLCGESSIDSRLSGYPFLKSFALEEQWRDL